MKQLAIAVAAVLIVGISGLLVLAYMGKMDDVVSLFQPGFTNADVLEVDQQIKEYYEKQTANSPSALERQELANGTTTFDVQMIKVANRRLEGFVTISIQSEEAKNLGLDKVVVPCEATMGMDSKQWVWKCQK